MKKIYFAAPLFNEMELKRNEEYTKIFNNKKIELKSKHIELYTDVDNVTNLSPNKGGIVNEKNLFCSTII